MKPTLILSVLLLILSCDSTEFARVDIPEEPITCIEGDTIACLTGDQGICENGTKVCDADGMWSECVRNYNPTHETCNNLDDNCDGQIDNLQPRTCFSTCGSGVEICTEGQWNQCSAPLPRTETCNNQDDNCNGSVDDIPPRLCNRGCADGREYCTGGSWGRCDAPTPEPELCDGIDNDCDGNIDQNLAQECYVECGAGFQTCDSGEFGQCINYVEPEVCDNQDNDCDGEVDENCGIDITFILDASASMEISNLYGGSLNFIEDYVNRCINNQYGLVIFGDGGTNGDATLGKVVIPQTLSTTFISLLHNLEIDLSGCNEFSVDALLNVITEALDNLIYTSEEKIIILISDESPQHSESVTEEPYTSCTGYANNLWLDVINNQLESFNVQLYVITQPQYFVWWDAAGSALNNNISDLPLTDTLIPCP